LKPIEFAIPVMTGPLDTPAEKVKTSKALATIIKGSPDYVPGSELDTALLDFAAETTKLEDAGQGVVKADLAATMARTEQAACLLRWGIRKRALLNAARLSCDGSAPKMKAFGFGVLDPQEAPLAVVPQHLRPRKRKVAGVAAVVWDVQLGEPTFMVQHATDPNDPATYSAPAPSSKASFKLLGQTPGATIHFRVYAIDPRLPAGRTDDSAWLAILVGV
jgi:hypothetical protein